MKRLIDWDKVFINYLCSGWCGGLKNNPTHLPEPDLTPMYLPSSCRPNLEDRMNRKLDNLKNDKTTEKAKNHKTKSTF